MSGFIRVAKPAVRLGCETLEDRATPAFSYALSGASLLAFDTSDPANATPTPITGVPPNESLVGIDFRAQDNALYGLGVNASANTATLYRISTQTGQATAVSPNAAVKFVDTVGSPVDLPDPSAVRYGLDFDPVADRLRVVTANGLNFRVDPNTGMPIDGDTGLAGAVNGVNTDGAINGLPAGSTGVSATAYAGDPTQPGVSKQYTLDVGSNAIFVQQTLNSGTQTQRVDVTLNGSTLDFTSANGFDISADGAFAALTVNNVTRLYRLDLVTGVATDLGPAPSGITGLALAPPGGTIAFAGATFVASESGVGAEVTLTRTGSTVGQVTVTVTATDGTATAGPDFLPGPYVVSFAPGPDTATLVIPVADDGVAEGDESFTLTLTAPTGGATIGTQATATLTITDSGTPPPPPTPSSIVVGAGVGAGAVNVLNPDGSLRSVFLPYGEDMRSGVRVATGDVNGDGVADIITTPAVGAPHVKVFDGATGAEIGSFMAFDPRFMGGLTVAAGDVNGDGASDILVGAATGSSHVKVFSGTDGSEIASFLAYGGFGGGVTVAAGDVNGDGLADIVTGTATGSSHVKVFAGGSLAVLQSTFAFVGHARGVTVAAGDVNGDGNADVVVGTAAGWSRVKVYSGRTSEVFYTLPTFGGFLGGVNVAARDLNGDGLADLLVGTATDAAHVKGFAGGTAAEINSFLAFGAGFRGGVFVS